MLKLTALSMLVTCALFIFMRVYIRTLSPNEQIWFSMGKYTKFQKVMLVITTVSIAVSLILMFFTAAMIIITRL